MDQPRERPAPAADEPLEEFVAEEFEEVEIIEAELVEDTVEGDTAARVEDEGPPRKRRRRRRGGRRSRRDRPESAEDRLERPADEPAGGEQADLEGVHRETEAPAPTGGETERTGRPRRRRRRGSGRKRDGERAAGSETPRSTPERTGEAAVDDDESAELEQDDLAFLASDTGMGDSALGDAAEGEEDAGDGQLDKNSHRAIPAWEEAIGYIISVNMEARAKNPKAGAPRGRGRGRGRGNSRGKPERR